MKNPFLFGLCAGFLSLSGCIIVYVGPPPPPNHPGEDKRSQHEALRENAPGTPASAARSINIDFGPSAADASPKSGAAAAGQEGDFWNTVARPFENAHRESGIKTATGQASPIEVELKNLGGSWGCGNRLGIQDPMLDSFNYPVNNQGGNSEVILHAVPSGKYDLYIYGHGTDPNYYGDYTASVGNHGYGRKTTFHKGDHGELSQWKEGWQYVKWGGIRIEQDQPLKILIQPGGEMSDGMRTFSDAIIAGLQLIPAQ